MKRRIIPIVSRRFRSTQINATDILQGNRVSLSRAITLIESFNHQHFVQAQNLLNELSNHHKPSNQTFRIGIAGPPGAGKSTFIESFGTYILNTFDLYKVAVLAIDPSSTRTGGSILGDKTRMDVLSHHPKAFVRPSPTSGKLGGIAEHTSDVISLCESAGFNLILVETVGLGQSEVLIDEVVDFVIMLTPPQMGDELQGVKKGIMEIADMVVVNKCDGPLEPIGRQAKIEYTHTFQLLRRKHKKWRPRVKAISALQKKGLDEVWNVCFKFWSEMKEEIAERREEQKKKLVSTAVQDEVTRLITTNEEIQKVINECNSSSTRVAVDKVMKSILQPYLLKN